jgi:hypothetical protein
MAKSQNGWTVIDSDQCAQFVVNGVHFPNGVRRGDVEVVLRWVAVQFHNRVDRLVPGWCWGYNKKKITGGDGSTWSNHASGTAIDVNAPDLPQGQAPRRSMTQAEIDQCHAIERESGGVVRWGGDFSNPDPMHWEIVGNAAAVTAFARKIQQAQQEEDDMTPAEMTAWAKSAEGKAALAAAATTGGPGYKGGGLPSWDDQPEERNLLNAFTAMFENVEKLVADVAELKAAHQETPPPPAE